jgi:hypothetical protein
MRPTLLAVVVILGVATAVVLMLLVATRPGWGNVVAEN